MHSHLFLLEILLLSWVSGAKLNEAAILQSYNKNFSCEKCVHNRFLLAVFCRLALFKYFKAY